MNMSGSMGTGPQTPLAPTTRPAVESQTASPKTPVPPLAPTNKPKAPAANPATTQAASDPVAAVVPSQRVVNEAAATSTPNNQTPIRAGDNSSHSSLAPQESWSYGADDRPAAADNECLFVAMGTIAHHRVEREGQHGEAGVPPQHVALVSASELIDGNLAHRPEELSKSGHCLHLHTPHHVTRRGEIVFAPSPSPTLESNTIPAALTAWPMPPPTPGNYGRLQSISAQLTVVGCHRYEPEVIDQLAYVDRAILEGPNRRGYLSVERSGASFSASPFRQSATNPSSPTYFAPSGETNYYGHMPSLVGSMTSPYTPRRLDLFNASPSATNHHLATPASHSRRAPKQGSSNDEPRLVSVRTETFAPLSEPSLFRIETSPLAY